MKIIFKKLISLATVIALTAGYTISASAGEKLEQNKDTILFEENYDGEKVTEKIRGTGTLTTDTATGNKYMYMKMVKNADWARTAYTYQIPEISEGLIQIKFDYMTNATTDQSYVLLANGSYYEASQWLRLLGASNGKFNVFNGSNSLGSYAAGKWYTQVVTFDMETHDVKAALYEKGGTTPIKTVATNLSRTSGNYSDWPQTSNSFVRLMHYGNNDGYIDNIEIKKLYKDVTLIFEENYDGDVVVSQNSGSGEVITDSETGNKYMKIDAGWMDNSFSYKIPEISSGKISIEFDYMKDSSKQSYLVLGGNNVHDSKNWIRLLGAMAWGTGSFTVFNSATTMCPITAGQWYTQKIIINMDKHEVSCAFYKKGEQDPTFETGPVVLPKTTEGYSDWPDTATSFTHIRNFGDVEAYIDNIKIRYVYDDPKLSESNISIETDDGIIQSELDEVVTSAKVINLDFGTTMKKTTMTDSYIYVTKKGEEEKIPAKVTYENGVAKLTADNNWEVGAYTLHVSKDVANYVDVTLEKDFTLDFETVDSKVIKAVFTDINGKEILCEDGMKIAPEIAKMDIYFYGTINETLLDEITLLENKNPMTKGIYDSGKNVYTVTFDNYLKQKSEYVINVPAGITARAFSKNFTTDAGVYKIVSVDFCDSEGNATDVLANIKSLNAKIVNTAQNKNSYRLIGYAYSANTLKNIIYKDFEVASDDANVEISLPVAIDASADTLKNLLWDKSKETQITDEKEFAECTIADGVVSFENALGSKTEAATVKITVYRPGKSSTDLSAEKENISVVAAGDYIKSGAEGEYSFAFKIDGETGFYDVLVKSDAGDKKVYTIFVNDRDKAKNLRIKLNNATSAEEFYNIIYDAEDSYKELGFYSSLEEKADLKKVSDLLYQYVNDVSKLDEADDLAAVELWKKMYAIELVNENNLPEISETEEYIDIKSEAFYKYYEKEYIDDDVKNEIFAAVSGKGFAREEEYKNAILEQIVLKTVENSDAYGNIRDVLEEFEKETGIETAGLGSDDYTAVLSKTYQNYEELEKDLKKTRGNAYTGSGGGGSSGGGSSSGKSEGIKLTVENTLVNPPVAVPVKTEIFTDISDYEWAREAIEALYEQGIVSGKSEKEFAPKDNITREEFAAIIVRAMGIKAGETDVEFADVPEDAWYAEAIKTAASAQIIFGKDNSNFGVGENITRQDMAVIIARAINASKTAQTENKFTDDDEISEYAKNSVYIMREQNIISGFEDGSFSPLAEASRAQAAVMIYKAFN